jgi:alpha-N-arabinofuranosidase
VFCWLAFSVLAGAVPAVHAQRPGGPPPALPTGPISATIDLSRTAEPIDRRLYGYFIENLGNMFEGGMWAEKLGDRKFFYPVTSDSGPARNTRGAERWRPLGQGAQITMDSSRAWVGKHSPRVALEATVPRGLQQGGLSLTRGRNYTGRLVLATDAAATGSSGPSAAQAAVEVSLVWGPGGADRQTVAIAASPSADYRTIPFGFTSGGTTRDGRIEISATGAGSLHIGAVSLMPADNVEGFRADLIAELKQVNPTHIRWGGNFSSGYDWHDGIGDRDRRPPRFDYAWNVVEQNDVGTLEVLALNRLLGAEPNIGVNSGLGDAHSAAEWVEYVNGSQQTRMGSLRAQHGHSEPFGVKWWGIGNEMYGQWQLGHMEIGDYVLKHNMFAEAMRAVDPGVVLVASGATPFETGTTARHHRKPLPADRPYGYESPEDWSGRLLRNSWRYFEYLAEHIYAVPDQAFDAGLQEFWPVQDPLHNRVRRVANRVRAAVESWEEYQRRMPYLKDSRIRMVLDEWSSGGGTGGEIVNALVSALTLNEMFRRTDVWTMSAYTGLTGTVAYDRSEAKPTMRAVGQLFKLYTEQLGSLPVAVTGDSPQPELRGTIGVDKPRVPSGSPTFPLDVLATLSSDRRRLTIAVVNPSESPQTLRLAVAGGALARGGKAWTLASREFAARSMPGQPSPASVTEAAVPDPGVALNIEPVTIKLYRFELQ